MATTSEIEPDFNERKTDMDAKQASPIVTRIISLSKIDLPMLNELIFLKQHFDRVEKILIENGAGFYDEKFEFHPNEAYRYSILLKLGQSIKIEKIRKTFDDLINYSECWTEIKNHLFARFASRNLLIEQFRIKLKNLHYIETDDFIHDSREIWRLARQIYGDSDLKKCELIEKMCSLLPTALLQQVLTLLRIDLNEDWAFAIEFDIPGDLASSSFCGAILACSKIYHAVNATTNAKKQLPANDRVKVINSEQSFATKPERFNPEEFSNVLVVTTKISASGKTLREIEEKIGKTPFKAYTAKTGKSRGYFVGCNSKREYDTLAASLERINDCFVREYENRNAQKTESTFVSKPIATPKDKVSRIESAPMEYAVAGKVELNVKNHSFEFDRDVVLQVDSGAGLNYIICNSTLFDKLRDFLQPATPFNVLLADNSSVTVNRRVRARVSLFGVNVPDLSIATSNIDFYILPSNSNDKPQILLGRDSISDFDLTITKSGVSINGTMLMETGHTDKIALNKVIETVEQDCISNTLDKVVKREWVPLIKSPEYQLRLTPIEIDTMKDHPDQTHVFEIKIPDSIATQEQSIEVIKNVESQTRAMLYKLPFGKRSVQKELVKNYENVGWWEPKSVDECKALSRFSPVPVFMVCNSLRKPRLVVNFKPVNALLPPSSTPGTVPSHLIAALRSQSPECIVVCDASSAFYKLRLSSNDYLWLVVAIEDDDGNIYCQHYISNRVVFGVVFGPSALITSIHELFTEDGVLTSLLCAYSGWYIDDNVLGGSPTSVVKSLCNTVSILRRVGHDLQLSKSCAIATKSKTDEFAALLATIGDITVTSTASVFGSEMFFDDSGSLRIKCNQVTRLAALNQLAAASNETKLTKAEYFSICGAISYDLMKEHFQEKFIADAMRSVIGREFSDIGWHVKLDLNLLSAKKKEAMKILFEWSRELINQPLCLHQTSLRLNPELPIEFNLHVDASNAGGGFCISIGSNSIWMDCWRWTGSETRWNINFQEVSSIDRALRSLADVIECLVRCTPPSRQRPRINIFSDNRSAVKWTSLTGSDFLSKHQSRRSLTRIIDSISTELKILKKHADVTIQHVSGCLNGRADELSRLGYRQLIPEPEAPTLSELVECDRKKKAKPSPGTEHVTVLQAIEDEFFEDVDDDPFLPPDCFECGIDNFEDGGYFEHYKCLDKVSYIAQPQFPLSTISATGISGSHHLLAVIDTVNYLSLDSVAVSNEPWIESVAKLSYDLTNVRFYIDLMKSVLRSWRGEVVRQDGGTAPSVRQDGGTAPSADLQHRDPNSTYEDYNLCIGRSAQQNLDREKLPIAMRNDVGPLSFDELKNVFYYRSPAPDGKYVATVFIPSNCKYLQSLIIRDTHRKAAHMGLNYTLGRIVDFTLHKSRNYAVEILKHCLFCQRKNASRQFKGPFDMVHNRLDLNPYASTAIDIVSLGDKREALSVLCLTTGHLTLSTLSDGSAPCIASACKRVFYRYSVIPKFILSDKAVNLSCAIDLLIKEFGNIEHAPTTAHSQFENGKLERLHKIAIDILSAKLHFEKIDLSRCDSELELQDLLDFVSHQINLRPLGYYVDDPNSGGGIVISPHSILYGNSCVLLSGRYGQLNTWKSAFFDSHWRALKVRSDLAVRGSTHVFYVNEPVLFFKPGSKASLPWKIAHVVDVVGNRCLLRDTSAKEFWMNAYNICPLKLIEDRCATDVSRIGATVSVTQLGILYRGVIKEERNDQVLVHWEPQGPLTWPPEWLPLNEVTLLAD